MQEWCIAFPAWNRHYVEVCTQYAIPAVLEAIKQLPKDEHRFTFYVHTNDRASFEFLCDEFQVSFFLVPEAPRPFESFGMAHREVVQAAPVGSNIVLLNADLIVSREMFSFADAKFREGYLALPMVGTRTVYKNPPPIGVTARELSEWAWANRHPIAEQCIWGTGRTRLPSVLFFTDGHNVVEHCFHLCPVMLRKDGRSLHYEGTTDDDLIERFEWSELYFPNDLEVSMAELSPIDKTFGIKEPLHPERIAKWAYRRIRPSHIENFKQSILIAGNRIDTDKQVSEILTAIRDYVPPPKPPRSERPPRR